MNQFNFDPFNSIVSLPHFSKVKYHNFVAHPIMMFPWDTYLLMCDNCKGHKFDSIEEYGRPYAPGWNNSVTIYDLLYCQNKKCKRLIMVCDSSYNFQNLMYEIHDLFGYWAINKQAKS